MRRRLVPAALGAVLVVAVVALYLGRDARGPSARISADGWYYHSYLVSLVGDRDLDFTDEYAISGNWYRFGRTAAGVPANPFGIGPAVFQAPFFAVGAAVAAVAGTDTSGFGKLHVALTLISAPLASVAALFFAVRLLRRRLGSEPVALWATLAAFAAGPLIYYAVRQPGYAHPFAALFTSWLLDAWDASYERPRGLGTWLGLGALFGAAALARPQLALWGIVLIAAVVDDVRRGNRAPLRWIAGGLAALAVFAPQLLAWKAVYGSWWTVPQGPGFMVWSDPKWVDVLFSSRNGLFAWSPLLAVATVGLIASIARTARLSSLLLAGLVLQLWANGAVFDWWGGGSFGGRRFDSCLVPFAYGLGAVFLARRALVAVVAAVAALCVVANVALAAVSNVFTLPEHLGRPVAEQLRRRLPAGLGAAAGALSSAITLPARAAFAWKHGAPLDAYDRVVGVHWLSEQYPGTGGASKPVDARKLSGHEPFLLGFEPAAGGARLAGDRGAILLSLNKRHDRVRLILGGDVEVLLDGQRVDPEMVPVDERGVMRLDIRGAPGTIISELRLEEIRR